MHHHAARSPAGHLHSIGEATGVTGTLGSSWFHLLGDTEAACSLRRVVAAAK